MQKRLLRNIKKGVLVSTFSLLSLVLVLTACSSQASEDPKSTSGGINAEAGSNDNQGQGNESPSKETPSISLNFSMDSDCAVCHKKPMESQQNAATAAYIHGQENNLGCITCHNQEQELTTVHNNATSMNEPLRLKNAKISEEVCLSCHGSYEELAAKTLEVTLLTDANGLTINPHTAKSLNAEHEEDINCLKCHTVHTQQDINKSQNYCMNCHHMKVYECNTCHVYHN